MKTSIGHGLCHPEAHCLVDIWANILVFCDDGWGSDSGQNEVLEASEEGVTNFLWGSRNK